MSDHSKGVKLLRAYHAGRGLTRGQGMLAKCADCMGEYQDGRADCGVERCPLYPWRPYQDANGEPEPHDIGGNGHAGQEERPAAQETGRDAKTP